MTTFVAKRVGLAASVDPQQPLTRLGLDSLGRVELAHAAERRFGAHLLSPIDVGDTSIAAFAATVRGELVAAARCPPDHAAAPHAPTPDPEADDVPATYGQRALFFPASARAGQRRLHDRGPVCASRRDSTRRSSVSRGKRSSIDTTRSERCSLPRRTGSCSASPRNRPRSPSRPWRQRMTPGCGNAWSRRSGGHSDSNTGRSPDCLSSVSRQARVCSC